MNGSQRMAMILVLRWVGDFGFLGGRIGQVFGGRVVRARQVMHGKTSMIYHTGVGVFSGLPSPFEATRYHSLVVEAEGLPSVFEVTAWTAREDGTPDEIMGLRHRELDVEGVQFHPESILTQAGHDLLRNFLDKGAGLGLDVQGGA